MTKRISLFQLPHFILHKFAYLVEIEERSGLIEERRKSQRGRGGQEKKRNKD